MEIKFTDFGFYIIDTSYLKYLHDEIHNEVYYSELKMYNRKPFLGIIIGINKYTYFLPLTSSKIKHINWKNADKTHYLLYEIVDTSELRHSDIFKPQPNSKALKILAVLDIKKMIPVPDGLYHKVDFSKEPDTKYRVLLEKEYQFCLKIQKGILEKAEKIYMEQKMSGIIHRFYCNFTLLEKACDEYKIKQNL